VHLGNFARLRKKLLEIISRGANGNLAHEHCAQVAVQIAALLFSLALRALDRIIVLSLAATVAVSIAAPVSFIPAPAKIVTVYA
jgi:hypothetical protein